MLAKETIIERAKASGAIVRKNEDTELEIVSSNGKLVTTYSFNKEGMMTGWDSYWVK